MRSLRSLALVVALILVGVANSQPPAPPNIIPANPQAPMLNLPQPFGAQAGNSVELTLTGTNLAEPVALLTGFPAKVSFPADANNGKDPAKLRVKLDIAPDAPIGMYPLRLATKQGVSNFRPFCIDSLPSAPAATGNRSKATAAAAPLGSVAAGRIDNETSEFFKIAVKPGQRVCVEVLARRLGSSLDPIILFHDAKTGRELPSLYADDSPGLQTDCRLTHTFKDGGEFLIEVRDSTHRGGPDFWYRLRIGDFPSAITPMPLAAKRGSKITVGFAGPDLDGVSPVPMTIPAGGPEAIRVVPKGHGRGDGWPVSLLLSDVDEIVEQEPNNDAAHANRVPVPCGISGRFQEKSDLDCYVFVATKGQRYLIDAQTQELLSPADVYMVLKDAKGGELAKSNPTTGAGIDYTAAADGDVTLAVEHLNYLHGPNEVYHLTIHQPAPSFDLTLGTDRLDVPANGAAVLAIQTLARHDYAGPVEISVVGPPGLTGSTVITATAPAAPTLPIALLPVTAKDIPPGVYEIRIRAKATINGKEVQSFANVMNAVKQSMAGLPFPPRELSSNLAVAITEPPLRLSAKFANAAGLRTTPIPLTVKVERGKDAGEEVALTVVGLPPNVTAAAKPIAKGASEIQFPLTAAANANYGTYGLAVIGKTKYQGRDFAAVAYVPLTLSPAFELTAGPLPPLKPGDKAKLKVTAIRKGGFAGAIDLELKNLPSNVTAAKTPLPAGKDEVEIEVTAAATAAAAEKADVNVTGTAAGQTAATANFKVTVVKK
ncbi:MAG: hypothetical protein ACJ8F7_08045 [Gemmataceae bacterium]